MTTVSLLAATPASAAPPRADLVVGASLAPTEVPDTGGSSAVTVDLTNSGTRASQDITLVLSLSSGTWFTDGFVIPPSWSCTYGDSAICTHAPLAAGEAAEPLRIPFGVGAGTVGDDVVVTAVVSGGAESSTANNTAQASLRYIPGTVDLHFLSESREEQQINGEVTGLSSYVINDGTSPSGDLTVTVPLPAGTVRYSETTEGWACDFGDDLAAGQPGWRCTHAPLRPGENSAGIDIAATISGAEPGDVIDLTATLSTTTPETNLDNNTLRTRVTVLQPATVRGTVWVDSDRDGVRDADEPGAPPGEQGIYQITVGGQGFGAVATVNADGTYTATVRPGTYQTEFYIRDPYSFISSPDSDVVYYLNQTGGYNKYGRSDYFTLAGGEEAVVDAGVIRY
ncbi:DUF11 domain-containing protein [Micromonospora costi]|uniref:DUF11 domain-containing protein n=1 Tax=Micromonospora costi TaxID=1530042 RepID=A0A3B0AIH2_9ACTN|nr:DUF11 domain-containing protein [Micromonospora costi]RKN58876.1 hypothetical protein D7193_10275 [Micromonospora costi]